MSTYIVEIDSTYRDVNAYVNQSDFAVPFKINSTTEPQVQGLPISPSGYFLNASIDPDFIGTTLTTVNGTITDYQRHENNIFVSGIAITFPFSIRQGNNNIISLTGFTGTVPYLCNITENLDKTYTYNWIISSIGTFSISSTGSSTKAICRLSNQNGIYWMYDFSYDQLNIIRQNKYNVTNNLFTINKEGLLNSVQQFISAFDYNGNPYFIDNHPYGYHILSSNWSLQGIIPNYDYNFLISPSQDLFVATNLNKTNPSYTLYPLTGTPTGSPSTGAIISWNITSTGASVISGAWTGSYVISGTGAIRNYTGPNSFFTGKGSELTYSNTNMQFRTSGDSEYIIIGYGNARFGGQLVSGGLYVFKCNNPSSSLDIELVYDISLEPWFPWPYFSLVWGAFETILGVNYFIICISDSTSGFLPIYSSGGVNYNRQYPVFIFRYDYTIGQMNYVSQTEPFANWTYIQTIVVNDKLYICGRRYGGTVLMCKYDPVTGSTTTEATLVLPGITSDTLRGYTIGIYKTDDNLKIYAIVSNRSSDTSTNTPCYVLEFVIATSVFTVKSSFLTAGYLSSMLQTQVGSRKILCTSWISYANGLIYDITNPSNVTLLSEIANPRDNFTVFTVNTFISGKTLLIAAGNVYDISDPDSIVSITYIPNCFSWAFDLYGYLMICYQPITVGTDSLGNVSAYGTFGRSLFFNIEAYFNSSHYYFNYQTIYPTLSYDSPGSIFPQNIITCSDGTYGPVKLFTANDKQIDIFNIENEAYPIFQLSILNPVQQASYPRSISVVSYKVNEDNVYFLAVAYSSIVYIYIGIDNGTNWSLVLSVLPSNYSLIGNTIGSALCIVTSLLNTKGVYCFIIDFNGYARKYKFNLDNLSSCTKIAEVWAYSNPSQQSINNLCSGYYDIYNTYVIHSAKTTSASRTVTFYIDDTSTINYVATTSDFYNGNSPIQQFIYNPFNRQFYASIANNATVGRTAVRVFNYTVFTEINPRRYFVLQYTNQTPGFFCYYMWVDYIYKQMYAAVLDYNGTVSVLKIFNITNFDYTPLVFPGLTLQGRVISITGYTIGTRTVLAMLFTTGVIFTYEVTNVNFCIQYPSPQLVTTSYNNIQMLNGSFVHKVDYNGTPEWVNVVGSSLTNAGDFDFISNITQDNTYLYISGSMTIALELYSTYYGTGTTIGTYPSNLIKTNTSDPQSFIAKCDKLTGKWEWCLPLVGTSSSNLLTCLTYPDQSRILAAGTYNSSNLLVYLPQQSSNGTGPFQVTSLGMVQTFFNNNNFSTGLVLCIDTNGIYDWSNLLFGETLNNNTSIKALEIDISNNADPRIIIGGISTATILECIDSSSSYVQKLYATNLQTINQPYIIRYDFSLTGSYIQSENIIISVGSECNIFGIRSFSNLNEVYLINDIYNQTTLTGSYQTFNKDGTLAQITNVSPLTISGFMTTYKYNSIFTDTNLFNYSQILIYNFTGPIDHSLINYQMFILGQSNDVVVNQNFTIRDNTYDSITSQLIITLNQVLDVKRIVRYFTTTNNIPNSEYYKSVSISVSPLIGVAYYNNVSQTGNHITFSDIYGNINIDTSKEYYLSFPQQSSTGIYSQVIPITSIIQNPVTLLYTATISNINDLRVPSPSGALYGPHIYLCIKNYSAFYSLQWYPGSPVYSQTYLVGLYDLIIPNRPIRNSRYPGVRTLLDYPYIYLIIYNSNEENNFDTTIINAVYDNNINVPRFSLFQLPTASIGSFNSNNNYVTLSSSTTPRIRFSPNYYNLSIILTDDQGNKLIFDNTPYKDSDSIFGTGVVPDSLLNVTVRLAFKKN
jgi:hypothetical protein